MSRIAFKNIELHTYIFIAGMIKDNCSPQVCVVGNDNVENWTKVAAALVAVENRCNLLLILVP